MSIANDLVAGVAQLLATAGVGTWRATGSYLTTDPTPIYVQEAPGSPHRVITVAHYPVSNVARTRDSIEGVQVRNRGLPGDTRETSDDADAIRAALDGRQHVLLGATHVSLIEWQSGAPLGQDGNRRWETVQNFYLLTARPSIYRED